MRESIKALLIVLAAIVSLVAAQTVRADELTVTGTVTDVFVESSTILIAPLDGSGDVQIVGVPFGRLEVEVTEGDCVTVEYIEKVLCDETVVNKFELLLNYCEGCNDCGDDYDYEVKPPNPDPAQTGTKNSGSDKKDKPPKKDKKLK